LAGGTDGTVFLELAIQGSVCHRDKIAQYAALAPPTAFFNLRIYH
jgi:hypothetical protein